MEEVCTPYKGDITEYVQEQGGTGSETWWRRWKLRNAAKINGRLPQFMESARADAKLTKEQWEDFFETHVRRALAQVLPWGRGVGDCNPMLYMYRLAFGAPPSNKFSSVQVQFDEGRIYNFDETGFFRNFIATSGGWRR